MPSYPLNFANGNSFDKINTTHSTSLKTYTGSVAYTANQWTQDTTLLNENPQTTYLGLRLFSPNFKRTQTYPADDSGPFLLPMYISAHVDLSTHPFQTTTIHITFIKLPAQPLLTLIMLTANPKLSLLSLYPGPSFLTHHLQSHITSLLLRLNFLAL